MYSAPTFDSMSEDVIAMLDPSGVEYPLRVGDYFLARNGDLLCLKDVPTDGPLFENIREEDEEFANVQIETGEFDQSEYTRLMVRHIHDGVYVEVVLSGTLHEFQFTLYDGELYPNELIQGGESFRIGPDDVPDFVLDAIEHQFSAEVTEG